MKEIAKAIVKTSQAIKGVEKSMTVGSGNYSYQGVSDKDVKNVVGKAMQDNGLSLVPIEVQPNLRLDRWTENDYKGNPKQKQQIFAEVKTKYLLLHTSGESIEVSGYGHGVDNQDKAAGKATTYALKYVMLYIFQVPTGQIDDSDNTHSQEYKTPQTKEAFTPNHKGWSAAVQALAKGEVKIEQIKAKYELSKQHENKLQDEAATV